MSGTSLDGVDAAAIETDGETVAAFGPSLTLPYEPGLRADLRRLIDLADGLDRDDPLVRAVEARLTARHAEAIRALGWPADLVGFHGQTILHRPENRLTWQIGDAQRLARETATRVVDDFRGRDVAEGGQGAPLVPLFHAALACRLPKPLLVLNLGGVANVTWLGEDGGIAACDTGPGCALLDDWAMRHTGAPMDRDGALAAAGRPDEALLAKILSHEFFGRPVPKSLDRQAFAAVLEALDGHSAADGAATLAVLTARAAARVPWPSPPARVLVTGGGRHNPSIMACLREAFAVPVEAVEQVGWDGDALEAQCFGYLAARVLRGLPLSLPATTGVPSPMPGGRIAFP